MDILAKKSIRKKKHFFPHAMLPPPCVGIVWALAGRNRRSQHLQGSPDACHRDNLKTCDKCHYSYDNPLFETILVIYPSICTAQSLGKNGGAHCLCMRCLAVTGTLPRDPILRLNIPVPLLNNESLLHVSCSVFAQLSISESYDTSSHKLS